jgi:hypothetical protein
MNRRPRRTQKRDSLKLFLILILLGYFLGHALPAGAQAPYPVPLQYQTGDHVEIRGRHCKVRVAWTDDYSAVAQCGKGGSRSYYTYSPDTREWDRWDGCHKLRRNSPTRREWDRPARCYGVKWSY